MKKYFPFPVLRYLALSSLLAFLSPPEQASSAKAPELPRQYVDTAPGPSRGTVLHVRRGSDFQAALSRARLGDVIELEAGAVFSGPFTLPRKAGSGWIVVRSSNHHELPRAGSRVDPSHARSMPKLEAQGGSVIMAETGAHHYYFLGIEVRPRAGTFLHNLVQLGGAESTVEELPQHIVFDRCYLHGDPSAGTRRGIAMNSAHTAVIGSHFSDFKELGRDSQAIASWNGPGPFKLLNNYLEAAGENVMFGGADPAVPGLVPSDIEIRHNHFTKNLAWNKGHRSYGGKPWTVKNILELKNARRVLIDGNLFEYNWVDAQNGFAILFTVRNQDGTAPWSVVEDVAFTNNVVRHTASGINLLGRDDNHNSGRTARILIQNNFFEDVGGQPWGGGGTLLQMIDGTRDVWIWQNTALHSGKLIAASGAPHLGFDYRNNIAFHNRYGIGGDHTYGNPLLTLNRYFPRAVVKGNIIVGGRTAPYPEHNLFPNTLEELRLTSANREADRLSASGFPRDAKTNIGVDWDALCRSLGVLAATVATCSL